ncbi:hypothetical protein AMELA_G00078310 [Ameiurus melas]|uniref:Uncharacterized protein n=1 Tax=Ameiurus melas TaxID=219545 RepID=A0A7J6B0V3_AMEME|nr:hypothetical protein AMELA_G00078310 [Ameiurus melas]
MASGAAVDERKDGELTDPPEVQATDNAEALAENIASIEEKIALCNMIVQDLSTIRRKVKEKGLCDTSLQEQTNQADFTL